MAAFQTGNAFQTRRNSVYATERLAYDKYYHALYNKVNTMANADQADEQNRYPATCGA